LEQADIACWIAPRDPVPGIPYGRQIIDAVQNARVTLLIFSGHANSSEHVSRELEVAANAKKTIVPFRIEAVMPSGDLQYYITRVHWLDAVAPPMETRLSELVAVVQQLLEGGAAAPATRATSAAPTQSAVRANVLETPRHNLPVQLTPLIGRDEELAEITALLERSHLVTLTGSGGIGKTRVALHIAADLLDRFADGAWFVELGPISDASLVATAVAQALSVRQSTDQPMLETLVDHLRRKRLLLILDNCEHLIDQTRTVASTILHACPEVRILATSRQGVNLAGEEEYRLPALATPPANQRSTTQTASAYGAVRLFTDRALSANKHFVLTDDNAPDVAEICWRLDGIPLAIELAAARVKVLSPKQLRERLDERFRVLTGGDRSALAHHQTMRALIDWSYDLLDERERTLFRRLGIFVSGFTLEGAVAVGSVEELDELDLLDVLASLVDKSLVLAEPQGDAVRYRLLESTRAYALEKLAAAGERELLAGRHLRYLRDRFAQLWERREQTAQDAELAAALHAELEDVRSALDGALARSEVIDGGALLASIDLSWRTVGLDAEGIARCETYLAALPADQSRLRARTLSALSLLLSDSGREARGLESATQAVAHARASGDGSLLAGALDHYATALTFLHRFDDAEKALTEAEAIPGTPASVRVSLLYTRALLSESRGDLETAASIFERLRREHHQLGNIRGEQGSAENLAEIEHARGHTQQAIAIVRETLPAARSRADKNRLGSLLQNLAGYLAAAQDLPGALAAAREAIGTRAVHEANHVYVAVAIEHLALIVALRGNRARAATLEGYADAAFVRHGFEREFTEATTHDRLTTLLRERLTPDELTRLMAEGAALTPEAAIALAFEEPEST
jgi:predicted ATPase